MPDTLRRETTEYLRYAVDALLDGVPGDPTAGTVSFAATRGGATPQAGDWQAGAWETITGPPRQYVARVLIGPAGPWTLARGEWQIWIRVQYPPETVIRPIDTLTVT